MNLMNWMTGLLLWPTGWSQPWTNIPRITPPVLFFYSFFLINGIGHSVTDLTCKTENWVISRPFVDDNSNAECHQPLNSLPGEMCQSRSERHRAREWITARGDVKGTFCAFLQHKHLSPSSPRSPPSALSPQTTAISASQVVEDDSEIYMFRVGVERDGARRGGRIGRLQPCKAPAITLATGPVQGCYFTSRWPEKKGGFQRDSSCRQTPGGRLQSSSRVVSQHLCKGSGSPVLFGFHSCSSPALLLGFFVFVFLFFFSLEFLLSDQIRCVTSRNSRETHGQSRVYWNHTYLHLWCIYKKKKAFLLPEWKCLYNP